MRVIAEGQISKLYALDKGDTELPEGAKVLGRNGAFQTSNSDIFNVVKKVSEIFSGFENIEEKVEMVKKIPEDVFWVGPRWLYKMWNKSNKEYIIILFYHATQGFTWCAPKQDGSMASLDYSQTDDEDIRIKITNGHMLVGTMHNHFGNRGSAFASTTDDHDEGKSGTTGVHFTMGYMDAASPYQAEFHTRLVSGRLKKVVGLDSAVNFVDTAAGLPELWDEKVDLKPDWYYSKNKSKGKSKGTTTTTYRGNSWGGWSGGQYGGRSGGSRVNVNGARSMVPYTGSMYSQGDPSDDSWWDDWEGWDGANLAAINPEAGEEYYLDDLNTFADDRTESSAYDIFTKSYPGVSAFAGGEELLHAAVMANELNDCIVSFVEDEDKQLNMRAHRMVMYDVMVASKFIEEKIETFFKDQAESCKKTSGSTNQK